MKCLRPTYEEMEWLRKHDAYWVADSGQLGHIVINKQYQWTPCDVEDS